MSGATVRSPKGDDPAALNPAVINPPASDPLAIDDPHEVGPDGLSRREREILSFERQWWKYAGSKEDAIKELFSLSATRYYQILGALVDRPEALAADPMLVKRLRRLRASRQKARAARRLGFEIT